VLNKKPIY